LGPFLALNLIQGELTEKPVFYVEKRPADKYLTLIWSETLTEARTPPMTAESPMIPPGLIKACRDKLTSYNLGQAGVWLLVSVEHQVLALVRGAAVSRVWAVSTATVGLDNRDGSGGTPPGLHCIRRKIGTNAVSGTVFASREATGEIWTPEAGPDDRDLILTRILTLDGLEDGLNRGPGVDSHARYIYIHGTNHPGRIGSPVSRGCVRMTSAHVRDLFELVEEGDPVVIV